MRFGIDVRYLSHGLIGGVHTYVRQFVAALLPQAREHELVLYADTKRALELNDLPRHVTVRLLPYRQPLASIANDLTMRRYIAADRLDVMHFPANYGFGPASTATVITVHDAINLLPWREIVRGHQKNPRTVALMTYLHLMTRLALRQARLLLTVSEHARREIARHSGFNAEQIVPIPHAPSPDFVCVTAQAALAALRGRYGLEKPFVLADALKNPATLIAAWRLLPAATRATHQIVFFSRLPDPLPIVREATARGEALLLIAPPRADLMALYSSAQAFVFPSWIEGFGIPVLEAMTCGAPVIASDRGAIPEVAGGAALLAPADDAAAFAQHLARVLGDAQEAARLRQAGTRRAAQFSWQATASLILKSYQRAAQCAPVAALPARVGSR